MNASNGFFATWRQDVPAAIVVFLIALPLCVGIALASGAPAFAGIVSGVIGGIVVGGLSRSPLSVTGPAAGLVLVVVAALQALQTYEAFLLAVVLAGLMQIVLGWARLGTLSHFFPSAVVKGMIAAIGIVLILKQIPHALSFDRDYEGDEAFWQADGYNTFTELANIPQESISVTAIVISLSSLIFLLFWEKDRRSHSGWRGFLPGPLVVAAAGALATVLLPLWKPELAISAIHRVNVPVMKTGQDLAAQLHFPDFSQFFQLEVWQFAFVLCLVATLETLMSIEAADRLDPLQRLTPVNRELRVQGLGNVLSGLIGGLPIVAVLVRSSANISAGAASRLSAILHGVLLLAATLAIPRLINLIPLASLAGILIYVGYQMADPQIFVRKYRKGLSHFIPFMATIVAILFSDLFTGVCIGLLVGMLYVLKSNYRSAVTLFNDGRYYLLRFKKDLSFLHKYELKRRLAEIPAGAEVLIDLTHITFVDMDNAEIINDFIQTAPNKGIDIQLKRAPMTPDFLIQEPT